MAITTIKTDSNLASKAWSKRLVSEIFKTTQIAPLIGTDSNSIIHLKDELSKGPGDKVTFGLRMALTGTGVGENTKLEGNEEQLALYDDSLTIGELVHGVRVRNNSTIDSQRVAFNLREEANAAIVDWYSDKLAFFAFLHFCGYPHSTMEDNGFTIKISTPEQKGFNEVKQPSNNRWIFAGKNTGESTIGEKDVFDLSLIDRAVECAKLSRPQMRPVRIGGEEVFVMYLHPTQVTSLRTNTNAGQWLDIQKAAYSGSRANNPIFDGSLGMYNGVVLRESNHITPGAIYSTDGVISEVPNVRRAVLLGAQAGAIAFGRTEGGARYSLTEELFDYQRELGVAVKTNMGIKKTRFNNEDFGTIVVSTYAAPSWK